MTLITKRAVLATVAAGALALRRDDGSTGICSDIRSPDGRPFNESHMGPGGRGMFGPGPAAACDAANARPAVESHRCQRDQIKNLAATHRDEWKALADRERTAHDALQAAIMADSIDEGLIRSRSAELAAVQTDVAIAAAHVRAEVWPLLSGGSAGADQADAVRAAGARARSRAATVKCGGDTFDRVCARGRGRCRRLRAHAVSDACRSLSRRAHHPGFHRHAPSGSSACLRLPRRLDASDRSPGRERHRLRRRLQPGAAHAALARVAAQRTSADPSRRARQHRLYRRRRRAHARGATQRARACATGGAISSYVLRRQTGINRGFDFYDDAHRSGGDGRIVVGVAARWTH